MAQTARKGVFSNILSLLSPRSKARDMAKTMEDRSEEPSEAVSGALGPSEASSKPLVLQRGQSLVGRDMREELFITQIDSMAQLAVSMYREQTLTVALKAARTNQASQAPRQPAALSLATMVKTFIDKDAKIQLQRFLVVCEGDASKLVPLFELFTDALREECVAAHPDALVGHPLLEAALLAMATTGKATMDDAILDASGKAIQAAIHVSSAAGSPAEGAWGLALHLLTEALSRAHDMEGYVALAASGDHHSHAKAAALAKLLAGVAGAHMVPVAAFLEAPASEQLFKAMAAIRCHPAPDIRAEGALFWRILLDTREVALPWAQSLQLQEASCLVALTRLPYMHLMDALFNSVVLPERTWDSMGMMEQIMLLKRRSAITEPLLEAAGVLDFGSCVEKIMSSWAERQVIYQWSHYEAVLFCLNILNRASPPLGQPQLMALFQSLPELPNMGHLPVTLMETVRLYTPWAVASANETPEEGLPLLDVFTHLLDTEEAKGGKSQSELASEASSLWASESEEDEDTLSRSPQTHRLRRESSWELQQDLAHCSTGEGLGDGITELPPKKYSLFAAPCCAGYATESAASDASESSDNYFFWQGHYVAGTFMRAQPMQLRWKYWSVFGAGQPICLPEVPACAEEINAAQQLKGYRSSEPSEASELDSVSSLEEDFPDISTADISDAESSTDPCKDDIIDAGASGHHEKVDCMGSPRDRHFPLERQGSSMFPGPAELPQVESWPCSPTRSPLQTSLEGSPAQTAWDRPEPIARSTHTSQVVPVPAIVGTSTCHPDQPLLLRVDHSLPSRAPRGAPPGFERPAAQVAPALIGAPCSQLPQPPLTDLPDRAAPAPVICAPTRPSYDPPLVQVSSGAAPAALQSYQCAALQVLLGTAAGTGLDSQADSSASRSAPGSLNEPAAQEPSAEEVSAQPAAASADAAAERPPSSGPGTIIGRLYWAAGALLRMAAGLCKLIF